MFSLDRVRVGDRWLETGRVGPAPAHAQQLVFLHDGLGCLAMWGDVPRRLAASVGAGAFAYSRAGYGGSVAAPLPRPVSFMRDEALDVLPVVLAEAGIQRPVLVGHSDGASIALIYAASRPDAVRALVLIAPHVFVEDVTVASITELSRDPSVASKLGRYHGANAVDTVSGWCEVWLRPEFREWNIQGLLPAIECPVFVVQHEADPYGTSAQVEAIASGCCVHVDTLMVPGTGHAPHRDAADVVLPAIASFLRRCAQNR